jgi:branched-chain amino acid transport system permease protein
VRSKIALLALALLIVFPPALQALDQSFYVSFASRIMIFALAATSLNLVLGYGGMVSFGHAAFFGAGAYTVAILAHHGVSNAWIAWPLALLVSAALALAIGVISLRTRGVYFIMITLAFAQMVYYLFVSLKDYGSDDGLSLAERSAIGLGVRLQNDTAFYYVVLVFLGLALYALSRLGASRFGQAIRAIKENETRAEAIGFPVFRLKLACFVMAGAVAGLAGALIANQNTFVSPSLIHWTQSGLLMVMVIVGGTGYLYGGALGAAVLLVLEETLSGHTEHWQLVLGAILLAIVLFAPKGLAGMFSRR